MPPSPHQSESCRPAVQIDHHSTINAAKSDDGSKYKVSFSAIRDILVCSSVCIIYTNQRTSVGAILNKLANSTAQNLSSEGNSSSPIETIPHFVWNRKIDYHVHKKPKFTQSTLKYPISSRFCNNIISIKI